MNEEWCMMKDEWWMMVISSCWGVLLTDRWTDGQKDKQTDVCDCRVAFVTEKDKIKCILLFISLFITYFEHESNVCCCPNCPVKVEVCYIVPARYLRMILMILMMIWMKNTGSRLLMHHKGFWNLKLNNSEFVHFLFSHYLTISSTWARSILITFIFITRLDRCKSFHHFPQCHHNYVFKLFVSEIIIVLVFSHNINFTSLNVSPSICLSICPHNPNFHQSLSILII